MLFTEGSSSYRYMLLVALQIITISVNLDLHLLPWYSFPLNLTFRSAVFVPLHALVLSWCVTQLWSFPNKANQIGIGLSALWVPLINRITWLRHCNYFHLLTDEWSRL